MIRYVSDLFTLACGTACMCVCVCFQMIFAEYLYMICDFLFVSLLVFPVRHGKHVGGFRYFCVLNYFSPFLWHCINLCERVLVRNVM